MEGSIILLQRQKGVGDKIRNWQSISIVKYSLEDIANCVESALGQVIDLDWTCTIPGTKISDNLVVPVDMVPLVWEC